MRNKAKFHSTLCKFSVSVLLTALYSCMADTQHLAFLPIGNDGWAHADTLTYTIAPQEGYTYGGISLLLHTEGYTYENIALGVTIRQDTTLLYHEQRSYRLDRSAPKSGIGRRCDYTLPIGNVTLCDTLPTTIILTQQIDQPVLTGIREVGISMSKPLPKPGEAVWKVEW